MRGFEVEELGVGDNMSGLVRVMEWTSVLVITVHSKKRKTKRKSCATKDHRQSKLFYCINRSGNKLTLIDSPFRLLSSFPVKS